ncbi:MAG: phosphohydrolase [Oscillospiraceae bacterium]|jgi:uncharacterized protein|nr:phosphohydrolase [Oscillospiraceae bacterium]
MAKQIDRLLLEMVDYDSGDAKRIQHFIKVHSFAKLIGETEHLPQNTQFCLEAAAVVHDIGIHEAERKNGGQCGGALQEKEGPPLARAMLQKLAFPPEVTDRVCYLVGHHHTYSAIDALDYRILVEADFLVNLYEDTTSREAAFSAYQRIFRTTTGRLLCRQMFLEPRK